MCTTETDFLCTSASPWMSHSATSNTFFFTNAKSVYEKLCANKVIRFREGRGDWRTGGIH